MLIPTIKIGKPLIAGVLLCASVQLLGQELEHEVTTEIISKNQFELRIVGIYPDSFPIVSSVFQAQNNLGEPLWQLEPEDLEIYEDDNVCEILSLTNVSKNQPLNIGLVFDHSGSMVENPMEQPDDIQDMQFHYFNGYKMPNNYTMALDYAKNGVFEFLNESKSTSDSVLFVGFSAEVDVVLPLTNDFREIKKFVKDVEPFGNTSFYDAVYLSVDKLKNHESKAAIVALTDGQDNASVKNHQHVVDFANKHGIAIYVIGLGNVYEEPLRYIAEQTEGYYYYTNDPNTLVDIYKNIQRQLKSVYEVRYRSVSMDYLNDDRNIRFSFSNDTMAFKNDVQKYALPDEVIAYLKEKEEARIEAEKDAQLKKIQLGLGITAVLLVGAGGFVVARRRKSIKIDVEKVFPNPFRDRITVQYAIPAEIVNPRLEFWSSTSNIKKTVHVLVGTTEQVVDVSDLAWGWNFLKIVGDNGTSETHKILRR